MRDLVEIEIDAADITVSAASAVATPPARRPRRAARGRVDARQVEAGERLRRDYKIAQLGPRVTMRWGVCVDGGASGGLDPTLTQIAAKRRFDAAVQVVGRGLNDVLWRVVCAGAAIPAAERALGWPGRAGQLVLAIALDRLAA